MCVCSMFYLKSQHYSYKPEGESFKALYGYYEAAGGLCDFLFLLREQ